MKRRKNTIVKDPSRLVDSRVLGLHSEWLAIARSAAYGMAAFSENWPATMARRAEIEMDLSSLGYYVDGHTFKLCRIA